MLLRFGATHGHVGAVGMRTVPRVYDPRGACTRLVLVLLLLATTAPVYAASFVPEGSDSQGPRASVPTRRPGGVRVSKHEPPLVEHARRVCRGPAADSDPATTLPPHATTQKTPQSARIVRENCRPGASPTEWDVNGAGDPTIQGFATDLSVNVGSTVSATRRAPRANVASMPATAPPPAQPLDAPAHDHVARLSSRLPQTVQRTASMCTGSGITRAMGRGLWTPCGRQCRCHSRSRPATATAPPTLLTVGLGPSRRRGVFRAML